MFDVFFCFLKISKAILQISVIMKFYVALLCAESIGGLCMTFSTMQGVCCDLMVKFMLTIKHRPHFVTGISRSLLLRTRLYFLTVYPFVLRTIRVITTREGIAGGVTSLFLWENAALSNSFSHLGLEIGTGRVGMQVAWAWRSMIHKAMG